MDFYPLALYTHFLALVGAVAAATVMQAGLTRLRRAGRVSEGREALSMLARVAPIMPLFALALFASGAYLVHLRWEWSQGWVIAGIVGLLSMPLIGGAVLKPRFAAIGRALPDGSDGPIDKPTRARITDPAITAGMNFNHAVALLVMLVMVTKPTAAIAFTMLGVAPIVAAWTRFRHGGQRTGSETAAS